MTLMERPTYCYRCKEPIPNEDYRIEDGIGQVFHTVCYEEARREICKMIPW